jgi:glycerate kinase
LLTLNSGDCADFKICSSFNKCIKILPGFVYTRLQTFNINLSRMNILIAPNAFKHSLNAQEVAEAIAAGLKQSKLTCNCRLFPVGDGGDGTGGLIIQKLNGKIVNATTCDALGRKITAAFGLIDNGKTAVIEMANASGLRLLEANELNPLLTNTFGTGELIRQALDKGARKIIIGMGGSATVDGGTGILSALGVRFLDADGNLLNAVPAELTRLAAIDRSGLDKRIPDCEIIILCDVDNQLLGDEGAAAVFGPQKGATADGVVQLDAMLATFATATLKETGIDITSLKHGGTAGGAAAGLYAFLNAKLVSGATYFLELTGFDAALEDAELVFTGEGSIDGQTLQGKAPAIVAAWAKKKNLPVIGLAGKVPEQPGIEMDKYFNVLRSINNDPVDLSTALKNTRPNLIQTACQIGDLIASNGLQAIWGCKI